MAAFVARAAVPVERLMLELEQRRGRQRRYHSGEGERKRSDAENSDSDDGGSDSDPACGANLSGTAMRLPTLTSAAPRRLVLSSMKAPQRIHLSTAA